jgi:hypothetical protein
MPPPRKSAAAIPTTGARGTKKTFDEDEPIDLNFQAESSSSRSSRKPNKPAYTAPESEDDDDDDAPEAVGMSAGKATALKDVEDAKAYA